MSAQIKEALEALFVLGDTDSSPIEARKAYSVVRSALEAAQQEAEAWEVIGVWCAAQCPRQIMVTGVMYPANKPWSASLLLGVTLVHDSFDGVSRLEALAAAATWCRAELAK